MESSSIALDTSSGRGNFGQYRVSSPPHSGRLLAKCSKLLGTKFAESWNIFGGREKREMTRDVKRLLGAGVLLGAGLGCLLEGIIFRQLFQLHHMFSNRLDPGSNFYLQVNLFWDGVLHTIAWISAVSGLSLLWRAGRRGRLAWRPNSFSGSFLLGWGSYMVVEGLLAHTIFAIHHVVENSSEPIQLLWDLLYFAFGIFLATVGIGMIRNEAARAANLHALESHASSETKLPKAEGA